MIFMCDVVLMMSFMIIDKLSTFFFRHMKNPAFKNDLMLITKPALKHSRKFMGGTTMVFNYQ